MLEQITPLILTFNEQANIDRTLSGLGWAKDIVVVDSGSGDATCEILQQHGSVRTYQRDFDSHAGQWNFGLTRTDIKTEWVLALDADYVLPNALVEEIGKLVPATATTGYQAFFTYLVDGKALRCSLYPPVTVLFRKIGSHYIQDGHTQRIHTSGQLEKLKVPIKHDDRKSFEHWFKSQQRYARLEAAQLRGKGFCQLNWPDKLRKCLVITPLLVPIYLLFYKGLVLDLGKGVKYAGQRTLAEILLSREIVRTWLS